MRSGLAISGLCISVLLPLCAACSVENIEHSESERIDTANGSAERILGEWACISRQIGAGPTISVTSQESYSDDGLRATRSTMVTDFQGMQLTVKLRSQSRWSIAGDALTSKTERMDIDDVKARGGYAELLPLDELERSLRQDMRASVARGEAETFTIETLTRSKMVLSGTSSNVNIDCTR